mmetsp:Transcript_8039/g.8848  ORF Transcript_8039/g.8848 Transcript_8039/m.8848 type:complete len:201 (+) Transcript_8039:316-918(+)
MVSLEAPKKRKACGAWSAIWLMMEYLATRPIKIEPRSTVSLMFDSFAKKMSGWRIIGMAATGIAATLPYVCIMPSVHDHHLLENVEGNVSFTKSVPRISMRSTSKRQPSTVPTAFMQAVKNHRLGLARTAEQNKITKGPDITNTKRLAPESIPTMMGNQGAAANCFRLSTESFHPMVAGERRLRKTSRFGTGTAMEYLQL